MKNRKIVSEILVLGMLATVLAGCSKESPSAAKEDGESVIKFAVASPVTGDSAEYGVHFNIGAQIAADQINAKGGINGKKIVLETFDSKNDAKEATEVARLIAQDSEILATIGDFSSTCCMATAPIYEENKLVQVSPSAGLIEYALCPILWIPLRIHGRDGYHEGVQFLCPGRSGGHTSLRCGRSADRDSGELWRGTVCLQLSGYDRLCVSDYCIDLFPQRA